MTDKKIDDIELIVHNPHTIEKMIYEGPSGDYLYIKAFIKGRFWRFKNRIKNLFKKKRTMKDDIDHFKSLMISSKGIETNFGEYDPKSDSYKGSISGEFEIWKWVPVDPDGKSLKNTHESDEDENE